MLVNNGLCMHDLQYAIVFEIKRVKKIFMMEFMLQTLHMRFIIAFK